MTFKTLNGRPKEINLRPYLIDWDAEQGSIFSKQVLDFLRPYWGRDVLVAELPVAGTKMRYDFINLTKRIVIETDGRQHDAYAKHFHGNRVGYLAQIKRDLSKDKAAELNGFTMVRIKPSDLPLSRAWFKRVYDIDI